VGRMPLDDGARQTGAILTIRDWNRIAAEQYGLAQGVSNGFGGDRGPSEMPKDLLDEIITRFLKRVEQCKLPKP
jgi:hypothetical protein